MRNPKVMPTTYFYTLLFLSVALYFWFPRLIVLEAPYTYLGAALVFFGISVNIQADKFFRKKKTTVEPGEKPTSLITEGPFGFSRNPMYLGMASVLLGVSVMTGNLISIIPAIIFVLLMNGIFIPLEERDLEKAFGKKFTEYKRKVRKWI